MSAPPTGQPGRLTTLRDRFELRWRAGSVPRLEDFLASVEEADRPALLRLLLAVELHERGLRGKQVTAEELQVRLPAYAGLIGELLGSASGSAGGITTVPEPPRPGSPVETVSQAVEDTGQPPTLAQPVSSAEGAELARVPGYEILEVLGRGGMGVVYKARQKSLKRLVALKVILAGAHAGSMERARFQSEAEAVARLHHPNIVQVYEVGDHQGLSYFSLELMEGGTLSEQIARELPPFPAAAALVETLGRAIDHAHARGIIHRDLKPANVLLAGDGTPKVTDFGLAKQLEVASGLTCSGAILGTPSYMAPEQASGQGSAIGPSTDVYALGAILYELLTGRPPFKGRSVAETLEMVRSQEVVPPSRLRPHLPRDLETICLKALARDPAQRYPTALGLANDLARFRAGEPVLARRQGPLRRGLRYLRRRPWIPTSLAGLLLVAVAAGALLQLRTSSTISRLQQEVRSTLEAAEEPVADRVERAEALIAQLEHLDPAGAERQRELLVHTLAGAASSLLERGELSADDEQHVRDYAGVLEPRDPERAGQVCAELEKKLRHWHPVFVLAAPFAGRASFFAGKAVEVQGEVLTALPAQANPSSPREMRGLVLTEHPCGGDVELTARIRLLASAPADPVGLALNATEEGGYTFVVQPPPPGKTKSPGKPAWRLRILRKGVVLREREVEAGKQAVTRLELRARRQGEKLTFQVAALSEKALEYWDPFPLQTGAPARGLSPAGGVFGLLWPAGVGLEKLEGFELTRSARPSPLQEGDAWYEEGHFAEALASYRKIVADAGEVSQAARYKEGLCLLRLNREQEADELFREVAGGPGERWPVLADCQLWLRLATRPGPQAEADEDAIIERLQTHGLGIDRLASLVPEDLRSRILQVARTTALEPFLTAVEQQIPRYRRQVALRRLLETNDPQSRSERQHAEEALMRAHRFAGQDEEALQVGRRLLQELATSDGGDITRRTVEQTTWIQQRTGRGAQALADLERYRQPEAKTPGNLPLQLLPLHARILASLGKPAEAETDLDAVLAPSGQPSWLVVDACVLKGYLREQAGDLAGAEAAWRRGMAAHTASTEDPQATATVQYLIMAGRVNGADEANLRRALARLVARFSRPGSGGNSEMLVTLTEQVPGEALRALFRTPRGQDLARRLTFHDLSLLEYYRQPLLLLAAEALHQRALPGPLTAEQDELIWDLVRQGHAAFLTGRLRKEQALLLGAVWKTRSRLLWPGLRAALDPSLRGPMAYLLGQRLRRDGQPAAAAAFFRDALADAAPGSGLQRLAQAELAGKPR